MHKLMMLFLVATVLMFSVYVPLYAWAQEDAMPQKDTPAMKCPMKGGVSYVDADFNIMVA